ncbi:MAG: inositol monophosphatase family protein [Candidatus Diapherotrites archaeon]
MNEIEVAKKACVEAGKIAMKYFQGDFTITKKGRIDLVTNADVECEQKIKKVILAEYPTHSFLGEEEGSQGESKNVWIIDPIDGTTNFAHGIDNFSHSIALVRDNEIICGAVFDPVNKKLFTAVKGKGAELNGKKISVSKTEKLIDSVVITGFPYDNGEIRGKAVASISSLIGNCQGIRRFGSAALDFCFVAQGICDGFFEYYLKSWDVAAGFLIAKEAGATITDINGNEATINSTHFIVTNGKIHKELKSHLEAVS